MNDALAPDSLFIATRGGSRDSIFSIRSSAACTKKQHHHFNRISSKAIFKITGFVIIEL